MRAILPTITPTAASLCLFMIFLMGKMNGSHSFRFATSTIKRGTIGSIPSSSSSSSSLPSSEVSSFIVPSGLVAVHKPKGWSSSEVVRYSFPLYLLPFFPLFLLQHYKCSKIRYILCNGAAVRLSRKKTKIKVGHGGTLDPLAEGVLVLGVGEGTKLMDQYLAGAKGYLATALLGWETDTLDRTGS